MSLPYERVNSSRASSKEEMMFLFMTVTKP